MKIGNIKTSVNSKCSNGVNSDSEFEVVVDSVIQDMGCLIYQELLSLFTTVKFTLPRSTDKER